MKFVPILKIRSSQFCASYHPNLGWFRQSRRPGTGEWGMCKQHWERIMELIKEKKLPKTVNLLEVRAYLYACYLERKITERELHQFEVRAHRIDPTLPRLGKIDLECA
jgi:hypothetical protein